MTRWIVTLCLIVVVISAPKGLQASPWIGTIDPQLHYDLQILSEWGYVDAATTTFPVPWKGIVEQLQVINASELAPTPLAALQRLNHYLNVLKSKKTRSFASLYAATDDSRFTSLDGIESSRFNLMVNTEFYAGAWAGNLSVNNQVGGKRNLDQSFVAYQIGDWNLRLGAIDQWWGPATSSSLILSNNARPIPAFSLSRAQAVRSKDSWLSFLGPWYFTTQLGQLESDRQIPDAKLLMSRFNFKPVSNLELGFAWVTMWGGEGQGNGLSDLWQAITLTSECVSATVQCTDDQEVIRGNHLATVDVKYSVKINDFPVSLYSQILAETDSSDNATLFGLATFMSGYRVYLETSDTNVACDRNSVEQANCVYEDQEYQSGFRFHKRAIGSTYDSDARMLSVGAIKHYGNGDVLSLSLKRLKLNADQQKPSPVVNGNSEKITQLAGFYQTILGQWQVKVGGMLERSQVDAGEAETNKLLYTELKFAFY